jgi:hypothetical protein
MTIQEAIRDLSGDIDRLSKAYEILLAGMKTLSDQLEIARRNLQVLQVAFQQGVATSPRNFLN